MGLKLQVPGVSYITRIPNDSLSTSIITQIVNYTNELVTAEEFKTRIATGPIPTRVPIWKSRIDAPSI